MITLPCNVLDCFMKLLQNKIYYLIGLVLSLIISIGIGYFVVNLQSEGQIYNSMKNNDVQIGKNYDVDKNLNPSKILNI